MFEGTSGFAGEGVGESVAFRYVAGVLEGWSMCNWWVYGCANVTILSVDRG